MFEFLLTPAGLLRGMIYLNRKTEAFGSQEMWGSKLFATYSLTSRFCTPHSLVTLAINFVLWSAIYIL